MNLPDSIRSWSTADAHTFIECDMKIKMYEEKKRKAVARYEVASEKLKELEPAMKEMKSRLKKAEYRSDKKAIRDDYPLEIPMHKWFATMRTKSKNEIEKADYVITYCKQNIERLIHKYS